MQKITSTLFVCLLFIASQASAQIFLFDFGTGAVPGDCSLAVTVENTAGTPTFQLSSGLNNLNYFTGSAADCSNFSQSGQCARSAANWTAAGGQYYQVTSSTTNWNVMTFTACMRSSAGTNAGEFQLRASTDGATWTNIGSSYAFTGTSASIISISEAIPNTFDDKATVFFQLLNSGTGLSTTAVRVDKVQLVGSMIVPVELLHFEATAKANTVVLDWKTATERNNDYIAVERSADGLNFMEIGRRDGAGTTNQATAYTFTDPYPLAGINYYRLRQVDLDDTEQYSHIVKAEAKHLGIRVFPTSLHTPNTIQVDLSEASEGAATAQLFDMSGRMVGTYQFEAPTLATIALNHLSAGIYHLNIRCNGTTMIQKISVME